MSHRCATGATFKDGKPPTHLLAEQPSGVDAARRCRGSGREKVKAATLRRPDEDQGRRSRWSGLLGVVWLAGEERRSEATERVLAMVGLVPVGECLDMGRMDATAPADQTRAQGVPAFGIVQVACRGELPVRRQGGVGPVGIADR